MPVVRKEILISSCRPQNQLFKVQTVPGLLRVSSQAEMEGRDCFWFWFGFFLFFFFNLP